MCTAIRDRDLFGRTLDLECSYGETVTVTPRAYPLRFLLEPPMEQHFAMIGMAHVEDGVPLYYDAVSEAGLAIAALNFPISAAYLPPRAGAHNVASFELIPWLLGQCRTLSDAITLLRDTNIIPDRFRDHLPASPLHWMIADRHSAAVIEPMPDGLIIHDNPFGVLANEPPFPYHATRVADFSHVRAEPPENHLCPTVTLPLYSRGMGGIGLPGDFSSSSRFIRALFAKTHTVHKTPPEEISRFFHVMDTVSQPSGTAVTDHGVPIATVYTSCADLSTASYYFTTYACRRIRAVYLHAEDAVGDRLLTYPIDGGEDIAWLN